MLFQAADSGGIFEYVLKLREPDDENFVEVRKLLKGDRSRVKKLNLRAGDLQFFYVVINYIKSLKISVKLTVCY